MPKRKTNGGDGKCTREIRSSVSAQNLRPTSELLNIAQSDSTKKNIVRAEKILQEF